MTHHVEKEKRVVSLVAAGCDILRALGCASLLVGHAHAECEVGEVEGLVVCTESLTGEMASRSHCEAARLAMEALLWEAECGHVGMPVAVLEWALAPDRVILSRLKELKPDTIITKHHTSRVVSAASIEASLHAFLGYKVDIIRLDSRRLECIREGVVAMMHKLWVRDESLLQGLQHGIETVQEMCRGRAKRRVIYLQWDTSPILCLGSVGMEMWVWDAIGLVGGANPMLQEEMSNVDDATKPKVSSYFVHYNSISQFSPDILILTNPNWGLKELLSKLELHKDWVNHLCLAYPSLHLVAVHGPFFFSRPSPSILIKSVQALCEVLHPECQPFGHEGSMWATASYPNSSAMNVGK